MYVGFDFDISEGGNVDVLSFFVEFLFHIDTPLSEIVLSGWSGRETSKPALGNYKDEGDGPEAQDRLTVIHVRAVARECCDSVNFLVQSRSFRECSKFANSVETEYGGHDHETQVGEPEERLEHDRGYAEGVIEDTDRQYDRLESEIEHGCVSKDVDVGPTESYSLAFGIASAKKNLIMFFKIDISKWSSLEVEIVHRAI